MINVIAPQDETKCLTHFYGNTGSEKQMRDGCDTDLLYGTAWRERWARDSYEPLRSYPGTEDGRAAAAADACSWCFAVKHRSRTEPQVQSTLCYVKYSE